MYSEYTPIVNDIKGSECNGIWCWIKFCGWTPGLTAGAQITRKWKKKNV